MTGICALSRHRVTITDVPQDCKVLSNSEPHKVFLSSASVLFLQNIIEQNVCQPSCISCFKDASKLCTQLSQKVWLLNGILDHPNRFVPSNASIPISLTANRLENTFFKNGKTYCHSVSKCVQCQFEPAKTDQVLLPTCFCSLCYSPIGLSKIKLVRLSPKVRSNIFFCTTPLGSPLFPENTGPNICPCGRKDRPSDSETILKRFASCVHCVLHVSDGAELGPLAVTIRQLIRQQQIQALWVTSIEGCGAVLQQVFRRDTPFRTCGPLLKNSCNNDETRSWILLWQLDLMIGSCGGCINFPMRKPNCWRCKDCRKEQYCHNVDTEEALEEWDVPMEMYKECFVCCSFQPNTRILNFPVDARTPKVLWNKPVCVCESCTLVCDICYTPFIKTEESQLVGHGLCPTCSASCTAIM